jgi:hypothetical protein
MLTQEAPKLKRLSLRYVRLGYGVIQDVLRDSSLDNRPGPRPRRYLSPTEFEHLELNSINLLNRNFRLHPWIDINELKLLQLIDCTSIQPFLFSQLLQGRTSSRLRTLHIKYSFPVVPLVPDPMSAIQAVSTRPMSTVGRSMARRFSLTHAPIMLLMSSTE